MAAANAMVHWKRLQRLKRSGGSVSEELVTKTTGAGHGRGARDTWLPVLRPGQAVGRGGGGLGAEGATG